jgi:hypothetical protein
MSERECSNVTVMVRTKAMAYNGANPEIKKREAKCGGEGEFVRATNTPSTRMTAARSSWSYPSAGRSRQ